MEQTEEAKDWIPYIERVAKLIRFEAESALLSLPYSSKIISDILQAMDKLRHSCAHLLAAAVLKLWPDTNLTIGPAIESGFYYDVDFKNPITEADLEKIEKEMRKLLPSWTHFEKREVSEKEAKEIYKNNPYKLELIDEIVKKGETITLYKAGDFEDLCRGGHSENPSKEIGAFKLTHLAGAYWRGSEKNKMLTRIYGTAFPTQKELDEYLNMLEEAKKRDHKKLGKELELFFFAETSPGMAYWLPKGLIVYNTLYVFAKKMYVKYGYQEIATPQLNKKELYETSGHWTHYKDNMFLSPMSFLNGESKEPLEGAEVFGVKPMNCPNAMTVFGFKTRSYHDLPMRLAETSSLHRFELSGTLNGLFRIREFRQDDAHIFVSNQQIKSEFESIMQMIEEMYKPFGLTYRLRFGTRPEEFMGENADWDHAEGVLRDVLNASGEEYFEASGEGAFYGPKVDILMKDSLGREWQTGTIQLDFQQPKRFGLKYTDSDGSEKMPIVIHRAIYGSLERFMGVLVEHFAGAFPVWLAPVQVKIVPITDRNLKYAQNVLEQLKDANIRVEIDDRAETMQAKIRNATSEKIPYMLIIGDREEKENKVAIRTLKGENLGALELSKFLVRINEEPSSPN